MDIKIYYYYSALDKCSYYEIEISEYSVMSQWLWFYIGKYLKIQESRKFCILPYEVPCAKLIKHYKAADGTKKYGKLVVNAITKHYRKVKLWN